MKVKVAKWGNSLGVRLPKAAAEAVGAVDGVDLELTIEGRALKLVPQMKSSCMVMKEMLDEVDRLRLEPSETVEWGPDVGSEIIVDDYSRGLIVEGPDGVPMRVDEELGNHPKTRDVRSRHR